MRIIRANSQARTVSAESIFVGTVALRTIVGDEAGRDLRLIEVHFTGGARNKLHAHTTDQILVIIEGEGIVASKTERHDVSPGDVAFIPAGERHWHGAQRGKDMTHLAINGHGSGTSIEGP